MGRDPGCTEGVALAVGVVDKIDSLIGPHIGRGVGPLVFLSTCP